MRSSHKIIDRLVESKMVSVNFNRDTLKDTAYTDAQFGSESAWVLPLRKIGRLKIGKLKNSLFDFPLRVDDYVAYADFSDEYRPVAVEACPNEERGALSEFIEEILDREAELVAQAEAYFEETRKQGQCARCQADNAIREKGGRGVWMVNNQAWSKVPKVYQKKILCKSCFQKLTGLDPEQHRRFNQDGSLREM